MINDEFLLMLTLVTMAIAKRAHTKRKSRSNKMLVDMTLSKVAMNH